VDFPSSTSARARLTANGVRIALSASPRVVEEFLPRSAPRNQPGPGGASRGGAEHRSERAKTGVYQRGAEDPTKRRAASEQTRAPAREPSARRARAPEREAGPIALRRRDSRGAGTTVKRAGSGLHSRQEFPRRGQDRPLGGRFRNSCSWDGHFRPETGCPWPGLPDVPTRRESAPRAPVSTPPRATPATRTAARQRRIAPTGSQPRSPARRRQPRQRRAPERARSDARERGAQAPTKDRADWPVTVWRGTPGRRPGGRDRGAPEHRSERTRTSVSEEHREQRRNRPTGR
jgi:hypothetical protein